MSLLSECASVPFACCWYCCQVASLSNSPLVSQAVMSPMVTRSLLADPLERDALLALPYSRKKKEEGGEITGFGSACSWCVPLVYQHS